MGRPGTPQTSTQDRLEDLAWIIETDPSAGTHEAAKRLGISRRSLERWCFRYPKAHVLWKQLRRREYADPTLYDERCEFMARVREAS